MAKKYVTQGTLKKTTLADILIFILERKQTTRREIEYETGFSWGTVFSHVAFLLEKGFIIEEKSEQHNVGRATCFLKPNPGGIVSIGLDINRTGFSCEVVGLDSSTKQTFQSGFCAETQAEVIVRAEEVCQRAIDWCEARNLRVFSLGIAIQGAVNGRTGVSMGFPGIPDWYPCNLKEHFAGKFELPVYLGHDPKCMLLGEMHRQKLIDCVLIRIDDGIGMAVCLDGKILDDTERLELAHVIAVPGGKMCACGKQGCLEAYASIPSMAKVANVNPAELFVNPEKSREILIEGGERMAIALYNMVVLFKPQKLILTGTAIRLSSYMECAVSKLREENVEIITAPNVSAAFGAAVESTKSAVRAFVI